MDGGAWWATVHGVAKSRTRLSDFTYLTHISTSVSPSVQLMVLIVSVSRGAFIRASREYVEASGILLGIFLCVGYQSLSSFSPGPLETIPGTQQARPGWQVPNRAPDLCGKGLVGNALA